MSFFSILLGLFSIIFWIMRVAVALTASLKIDFFLTPLYLPAEIVLLFITFFSIILIFKRSMIGALIYLISHLGYFGWYIYDIFVHSEEIILVDYLNVLVSVIGVLLPLITLIDIGFSHSNNKGNRKVRKTDWFYRNEEFDRKYDERADKNQYKF